MHIFAWGAQKLKKFVPASLFFLALLVDLPLVPPLRRRARAFLSGSAGMFFFERHPKLVSNFILLESKSHPTRLRRPSDLGRFYLVRMPLGSAGMFLESKKKLVSQTFFFGGSSLSQPTPKKM
jgi:hypothetical protein